MSDAVAADAVHDHDHALVERADGERAVGVGEMMRDRHHLVRFRQIERALGRLGAFAVDDVALIDHANFQVLGRQDVAIAHHQIEIVDGDALGIEAIVDHFLKKSAGVLLTRYALLLDRVGDLAVAQQAGADVVVVGVYSKDIGVIFRHRAGPGRRDANSSSDASEGLLQAMCIRSRDICNYARGAHGSRLWRDCGDGFRMATTMRPGGTA